MQTHLPLMLAETSANIYYQFARLQTLSQWWHWLVLLAACIAITAYVGWMYRKDSIELPRGLAVLLFTLRLFAFIGILFFFFNLEKRAERTLVKNSRAILLVDTSQSMGLRDTDSTSVPAAMSRIEFVEQELARGTLIEKLREKHDVVVARFDEGETPVEVASFPRKPTEDELSGAAVSDQERLAQSLRTARLTAAVGLGVLLISLIAGIVYLSSGRGAAQRGSAAGEPTSWALLVSMTTLIAAAVIFAVASLRSPDISPLAIAGLEKPKAARENAASDDDKDELKIPVVDWAAALAPRGAQTRIGDSLRFIIDRERGGPISGVVLFTDGGNNAGTDYALAAQAAQDAMIPVFTVGLGSDSRPANLRVVDLEAPERVYPGDKFTVTGYVQAQGTNRSSVTVELLSGDAEGKNETREDEMVVDLRQGSGASAKTGQVVPVKFELEPTEQGLRQYKMRVKPLENELDRRDNEKTAKVEVIDRKTKILMIAGGPMRDFLFLRNQLYRDKEVTLDVWLQSGKPGISQEANEILHKFPETPDELFEYDAIVAFDPDWEALDELQVRLLDRWVAEKAGGLIVIAGPVFTPQWSSRRRGDPRTDTLKALYPVAFYFQGSATLNLGRFGSEKAWPLQFTRDGLESDFLWLDEDAIRSEQAWEQFEGVSGYYAVKDPKPGAKVYARFTDPDTAIDNELPIYMAGHFYGSGRVFFLASGEMWRVRAVDDAYFEQFYTKLIRWVSEGRLLRDSSRGVLLVDKDRCSLGDQVAVRAILQDAQHAPLTSETVSATLIQPDSTRQALILKRVKDEAREGTYVEQFTALQEGDYKIELQHPAAADQLLVREVRAKIPAAETESPERNDLLLRDIADKTGGDYFIGIDAAVGRDGTGRAGLLNLLKTQDQKTTLPGTPDRNFERLLMGWLMGMICGVLCLEWLFRRLSKLA